MEAEDSDSASVEYEFETQPGSVGFMVQDSQSASQRRSTEDVDVMQIWPALQPEGELKEQVNKSPKNCLSSVMDTSGDEQKPAEPLQVLATETELSESEIETEVTVIEKPEKSCPEEETQSAKISGKSSSRTIFTSCRSLSPQDIFENEDEEGGVYTPAGFVGSLHLSNQAMLVPETTESEDPLPSTPEDLVGLPKIIPSSPTDGSFQEIEKAADETTEDPAYYDPKEDSTLADEETFIKKLRKSDESELSEKKSPSSSGDKEDLEESRVQPESVQYNPKKETTLAESSDDQQSLHLHYSETQKSSHTHHQGTTDSVQVVGTEFMDVISIKSSDGTEIDQVPESQELSLRLTPSQSDKSSKETDTELAAQQQTKKRLPMVKSQDLVTERHVKDSMRPTCMYRSQPAKLDRNQDVEINQLQVMSTGATNKDGEKITALESEKFALSLPKNGELLHPKVSSGKSSKSSSQLSVRKGSQGVTATLGKKSEFSQGKDTPSRSRAQDRDSHSQNSRQGNGEESPRRRPSQPATKNSQSLENVPPSQGELESQASSRSFSLLRPDMELGVIRESEDTQQNVFKRTMSGKESPRKRLIQEDSDDEVTIIRKPKIPRTLTQHSSEGHNSQTEKSQQPSQSHLCGTPNTPEVEKSSEFADQQTLQRTPVRKIPSISSEGSQAKGSLQKKMSVSTEGGYQASIEEDQSVSYITDPVKQGQDPELSKTLIAIPVGVHEQVDVVPIPDDEPETSMVSVHMKQKRKPTPIVQTPISGKKRKCLTKLRKGSRRNKGASPHNTQLRTPTLTTAPTVIVPTTSSTSSEESSHIDVLRPHCHAEGSAIILSPSLTRASSLESVLSRRPLMSTSATPTSRPTKVRTSKTEPRFKVPVRTELDKSSSIEQQPGTSQDIERKTVVIKIKQFEVRTEIVEILRHGKFVSRSEKEIKKDPVTVKVQTFQEMEALSPGTFSSSSAGSSLTSGYLGDISSSLSRSGSSNVPSLGEHDIPLTQPSITSLEASSIEVTEVVSPAAGNQEPAEGAVRQCVAGTTPAQQPTPASVRSESITPNVRTGFVVSSALAPADVPSTSTGVRELTREEIPKLASSEEVSSEVPFQDEQNITATSETTGVGLIRTELVKDSRIMAKWKDGYYYPGVILKVDGSRYQVKFDDGDTRYVRHSEVLPIERLPLGQPVMVQSQDGYFDAGLIVGQVKKGGVFQYSVEKDSGEQKLFSRRDVILREDQANLLLTDLPTSPEKSIPEPNPAKISLDNLVEGKRRAGSKYAHTDESECKVKSKPTATEKPSTSKGENWKEGGEEEDLTKGPSTRAGKRKIPPLPQQATSTPTPKEKGRGARKPVDPESTPLYPEVSVDFSPIEPRRSPRKARHGLFDKEKRPVTPAPFSGLVFLLTYVEKSRNLKEEEKSLLKNPDLTSDDSSAEHIDDEETLFDKQDIITKIQSGGGVVLDKFDEAAIANAKQCFLISNSYQRTIKYFQCLAAAIPCVSHLWIRDSYNEGVLLDYKAYKLQAGVSIEKRRIMEWSDRKGDLRDLSVFVASSHVKFQEEWSFILKLAGCQVLPKLPPIYSDTPVSVIVTDLTCPKTVLRRSKNSRIPLVASEWVMQCLINGRRLSYTGHPRYNYNFHS